MKTKKTKKTLNSKYIFLTLVALVFGFMISYSYHLTSEQPSDSKLMSSQYERDMQLRNEIIAQEEKNQELQKELDEKQKHLLEIEQELANETQVYYNLTEDTEKYQDVFGKS